MELWKHQKEAVERARGNLGFALFFEQGTGKTATAIEILKEEMNRQKRLLRVIIFTPPMVVPQWREEWLRFSKIQPQDVVLLQGSAVKRLKTFKARAYNDVFPAPRIFITNYEALLMKDLFFAFQEWEPESLIFDESQRVKSHDATRSKQAYLLANPYDKYTKKYLPKPQTYLLSGTPILNSPLDVFQQYKVMLGAWPAVKCPITNFFVFRSYYFRDRNANMPRDRHFPKWEPMRIERDGFDALKEIRDVLDQTGMRVTKNECLDLPEEVSVVVKVGMSKEQYRVYEDMRKKLVAYIQDKACVAQLAITKALRLQQITSGFAQMDDGKAVHFNDNPKEEALIELLKEITPHSKVLLWSTWHESYVRLRQILTDLHIGFVEIHGGVSDTHKRDSLRHFKEEAGIRVLMGHPGSGGIGLNLTEASYSIFYGRTFSLEHYLQARARNHRGGQTQKVTHYDLVCENTIDQLVLEKLSLKQEIGENLLGDLKNLLAKQVPCE